jgi:aerobic carbon-monoxide dehydrogenase medium subunit
MYPSRFRYEAPRSLAEAIGLLADGDGEAKVLAGGQSLVPLMKLRFATPELLVDINNIGGLDYHREDSDGTLCIGALCRHADLERSALLPGKQPTMAAAAPLIADPIVRNRGTLVGSLCHADPQGDWASVMVALGGSVVAEGRHGRRSIPVADFVTGPFENVLEPDEIAVEAVVPPHRGTPGGGYLKLERRVGDFATVGVAVAVETSGGTVARAGIALTGVGGSTIACTEAVGALTGQALTPEVIEAAADLAAQAARPRTDHRGSAEYKRHMVRTFVVRILSRGVPEERAA